MKTMKIGLLATLEGPFAAPGQDSMRGADLALKERNGMAGGKKIEFIKASSDATPDKAVAATRKLVEQDKAPIVIGPLSGDEGIAVKNYAKTQPNTTFVNGSSGAQAATWGDPAPNFYRFNTEGAQWMVGLGEHARIGGSRLVGVGVDVGSDHHCEVDAVARDLGDEVSQDGEGRHHPGLRLGEGGQRNERRGREQAAPEHHGCSVIL